MSSSEHIAGAGISHHHEVVPGTGSFWEGGAAPYRIPSKKLGMWLFVISDAITFSAVLFAYGYLRLAAVDWPRPFQISPSIINATVMTFVLLSSSVAMVL